MIAFQFVLHTVAIEDFVKKHFSLDHTWHVTVMSSVPGCDVTTVQNHDKGSMIREASLLALRKFSQIYACSHVSIVRLVQRFPVTCRHCAICQVNSCRSAQYPCQALISICGIAHVPTLSFGCHSDSHQS